MEKDIMNGPSSIVRARLHVEKRPYLSAATLGIFLGIFGALFSLLLLTVFLRFIPRAQWGNSAASGLTQLSQSGLFFVAVIFAPIFETIIGQVVPIEFARQFRANWIVCVLLSGCVFGCGHFINGGLVHGVATFCGGVVFAYGYVAVRWAGIYPSFIAAATAHAMQNSTLLFIIAPYFPDLA